MIRNERGIALPMALIVMAILTALMAAFAVLATSDALVAAWEGPGDKANRNGCCSIRTARTPMTTTSAAALIDVASRPRSDLRSLE